MKPKANKVPVNCTFEPYLKSWATKYAKARFDESFSALCERLLKAEQVRETDRMRKAMATPDRAARNSTARAAA